MAEKDDGTGGGLGEDSVTLELDLSRLPARGPGAERARLLRETWSLEQLAAYVEARPGRIYAVLDACIGKSVWSKVDELVDLDKKQSKNEPARVASLFNGHAAHKYAQVAPYLVRVDAELLEWIRGSLLAQRWGIFVESGEGFLPLRRHLHSLLMARSEEGKDLYFRYYDGSVLDPILVACTQEEAEQIFGEAVERLFYNTNQTIIQAISIQ